MTLLGPGTILAGCRIDHLLGRGGMGRVYAAIQLSLDRRVAIKVLRDDLTADPAFRARFAREARAAAALDHPNVLPVYEAGEADGVLYMMMRLVDGSSLMELIGSGEADALTVSRIISQVAEALDAAHAGGMVHRDVKPQNILLASDDHEHAYLADFGLAIRPSDLPFTHQGQFVGSIDYIAPEVIQGVPATPATDLYGLGCTLYVALTGRSPFPRESEAAVLFAHVSEPPPRVTDVRPDLPVALDAVVARAMAKDPGHRYANARDLAADVLAALRASTPAALTAAAAPPGLAGPASAVPITLTGAPRPPASAEPPPASRGRIRNRRRRRQRPEPERGGDGRPPPPPRAPSTSGAGGSVPPGGDGPAVVPAHRFRLASTFKYVHDPLIHDGDGIPLLGNDDVIDRLRERIVHSSGGAFLVTGFRGVGKTTVIARAMEDLKRSAGDATVLPVRVNVARPRSVGELLFDIIRRVFETLNDERVFAQMSPDVQRELLLAYARTSLSYNETRSRTSERVRGLSAGLPTLLDALTPKLEVSKKTTAGLASQVAFLAYTEADVEHDFLRIVSLIEQGEVQVAAPRRLRRGRRQERPAWKGKLIVIIDELDKLTADEEGMRCVAELLSGLKNLLTARGVHFFFVAGPDLHDVALLESRRGNSVYESVFGWQIYVPCLWDATDRLLDAVIVRREDDERAALEETLRDYLRFKSRGVPRLLLMELNGLVRWDAEGAFIDLEGPDRARVRFYADLERVVDAFVQKETGKRTSGPAVDQDRWWLGAYYITDWVMQSGGDPFTADDLVRTDHDRALHPVFTLSPGKVRAFLAHLVVHEVVTVAPGRAPDRLLIGDVQGSQEDVFELAPEIRARLSELALVDERERANLGTHDRRAPWADSVTGHEVGDGRYELLEEISRMGRGAVYRARDKDTMRICAIKLVHLADGGSPDLVRARFARGAAIARRLDHPNIVRTYEHFETDDQLGLVMDFVDGTPLSQILARVALTAGEAAAIGLALADALAHVAASGAERLDLKPSNILIDDRRTPVIVGLDLAKHGDADGDVHITRSGIRVITPVYAAPEQLRGEPTDIRADVCALGLIMYEMVSGRRARRGPLDAVLRQAESEVDLAELPVSDVLREVIATATAPERERRYSGPDAMVMALRDTPECRPAAP